MAMSNPTTLSNTPITRTSIPAGAPMADENKPIHWAAGLVEALKRAHVGHDKVELIRQAMAARFNHADHCAKDEKHPDRHLTAREGIAILERAGVGEVTLAKARQLAATGMWNPPAPVNPADALPPPPDVPAPVRAIPVAEAPALTSIGGTVDLSSDVDTIGLKPIEGAPGDTVPAVPGQAPGGPSAARGRRNRRNRRPLDSVGPAVVNEDAGSGAAGPTTEGAPEG